MDLEHIVIENIKRIRKEKHITQEKLAEYCETSVSYIGLMETYKNIPKLSTIERIAEALNIPVLDLFALQNDSNTSKKSNKTQETLENKRKEKLLNHLKKELVEKISDNIDDIFEKI